MLFTDNYSDNYEDNQQKRQSAFVLESDPHEEDTLAKRNPEPAKKAAPIKPIVTLKISAAPVR